MLSNSYETRFTMNCFNNIKGPMCRIQWYPAVRQTEKDAYCNKMKLPPLPSVEETPTVAVKLKKSKDPLQSYGFALSVLGYCRNMEVQHGGLGGRGPAPAPFVRYKRFTPKITKTQQFPFSLKYTYYYIPFLPSPLCQMPLNSTNCSFKQSQ